MEKKNSYYAYLGAKIKNKACEKIVRLYFKFYQIKIVLKVAIYSVFRH
jgi:hypothetical protein